MINLIRNFFVVLGILFFIQVIGLGYLIIADPFHLRPLVTMVWKAGSTQSTQANTVVVPTEQTVSTSGEAVRAQSSVVTPSDTNHSEVTSAKKPVINPEQVNALEAIGLDASAIENITPAQEACFVEILGAARVAAVKAGAVPTASEFLSVRSCI